MSEYSTDGAMLLCTCGSAPSPLKTTANRLLYVQDKAVATTSDKAAVANIKTCSLRPTITGYAPCVPAPTVWIGFQRSVEIPGGNPLLETSTIECSCGGTIQFQNSGQMKPNKVVTHPLSPQIAALKKAAIEGLPFCEECEQPKKKIKDTCVGEESKENKSSLDDDFIPIVHLDKAYKEKGFKYIEGKQIFSLSSYIEEREYTLETVVFDNSDEIVLRFEIKKGNKDANDNRGCIKAIGNGIEIISQKEFTIKYDQKILLKLSRKDIKKEAYIDFYANDNDWKYYTVSDVHCGRVMIGSLECLKCGNIHKQIDLRLKIKWQSQLNSKWGDLTQQKKACKKACDAILNSVGLKSTSARSPKFQVSEENSSHTKLDIDIKESKMAIEYLNSELEIGHPILVGVDHTLGKPGNADKSTDHFVVIVGQNCDEKGMYYIFYEVGTGMSDENRLYLDRSDYSLRGNPSYSNNRKYTVTQVRKNAKK